MPQRVKIPGPGPQWHQVLITDDVVCPETDVIPDRTFLMEIWGGKVKFVFFKCPCGCGQAVGLHTEARYGPCWEVLTNLAEPLTMLPSVQVKAPCQTNFWIRNGRILLA